MGRARGQVQESFVSERGARERQSILPSTRRGRPPAGDDATIGLDGLAGSSQLPA